MPLFERGYRAAAKTELERDMREIEDRNKKAQTKTDFEQATTTMGSNINFAERLNLISAKEAAAYRKRLKEVTREMNRAERAEGEGKVRESDMKADGYMTMDEYKVEIEKERAEDAAQQNQAEHIQNNHSQDKAAEEYEHTH